MRIEQQEYIAAVTRHGSVRRASEHLHVSQPAMSEAITKLERELGVSLFERHRSGARLSRDGQALLGHMADALESIGRHRQAAGRQIAPPVVRIGTVDAGTSTVLVPAARRLGLAEPAVSVEVQNLQLDRIRVGLLEGVLDLGLVNQTSESDTPPDLGSTPLLVGQPGSRRASTPCTAPPWRRQPGHDTMTKARPHEEDGPVGAHVGDQGRRPEPPVRIELTT